MVSTSSSRRASEPQSDVRRVDWNLPLGDGRYAGLGMVDLVGQCAAGGEDTGIDETTANDSFLAGDVGFFPH